MDMDRTTIMKSLQAPFPPQEVEWRVQSCGISNGKPWVLVLAYIKARAIQKRLDDVFGWDNWQEEYRAMGQNVICRLSVRVNGEWISKENGASETNIDPFKGGISGAFKRVAASGFGIGRYLYDLEEGFANCQLDKPANTAGWSKAKTKDNKIIWWQTPDLPKWALPGKQKEDPLKQLQKEFNVADQAFDVIKKKYQNDPKKIRQALEQIKSKKAS